jgi:hypothetical protein
LSKSEKRLNQPVRVYIQHAKVAFRKSPSGDLGVKFKNIKGIYKQMNTYY